MNERTADRTLQRRSFAPQALLGLLLAVLVPLAAHAQRAPGSDLERLLAANKMLYSGQYLEPEGGAAQIYLELLSSGSPEVAAGARSGLGKVLKVAAQRAALGDADASWSLAEPILDAGSPELLDATAEERGAVGDALTELAAEARKAGRCSTALVRAGRALKVDPGNAKAAEIRKAIESNPGMLSIFAQPWGKVLINGRDTGLIAPVEKIKLVCGRYTVTLLNDADPANGKRSGEVTIHPGKETKLQVIGKKFNTMKQ
ncbi:MAG: hypothetical protein AB7D51_05040 [Desulfovibrionaceae bacterium]